MFEECHGQFLAMGWPGAGGDRPRWPLTGLPFICHGVDDGIKGYWWLVAGWGCTTIVKTTGRNDIWSWLVKTQTCPFTWQKWKDGIDAVTLQGWGSSFPMVAFLTGHQFTPDFHLDGLADNPLFAKSRWNNVKQVISYNVNWAGYHFLMGNPGF